MMEKGWVDATLRLSELTGRFADRVLIVEDKLLVLEKNNKIILRTVEQLYLQLAETNKLLGELKNKVERDL